MSEDDDKHNKTEEATEQKIRSALDKGNVPFSREAPLLAGMFSFLLIAVFLVVPVGRKLTFLLHELIDRPEDWQLNNAQDVVQLFNLLILNVAVAFAPIFTIIPIAGVAASVLQNTPRFVGNRIRPQVSRMSPFKGWKRIFGRSGQVDFLKSAFKFLGVSAIVSLVFFGADLFSGALAADPAALPEYLRSNIVRLLSANILAVLLIASLDLVWSRIRWRKELRMTKQEVKDERKQAEGDPLAKSRMRSLARDRTRRRMIAAVPTATLIVTNPTHFSVALRYRPSIDAAPLVIAKGQNLIAQKIREIAAANSIPAFEDVALARALYKQAKIDQMIAPEFYKAVAELIRIINSRSAVTR